MFCSKFGWNWHSGSGQKDKNVRSLQTDSAVRLEVYRQTVKCMDDRPSQKLTWAFCSGELKIFSRITGPFHPNLAKSILGWRVVKFCKWRVISILKREIRISLNQCYGIIITLQICVYWNRFSGEWCGPWASCLFYFISFCCSLSTLAKGLLLV